MVHRSFFINILIGSIFATQGAQSQNYWTSRAVTQAVNKNNSAKIKFENKSPIPSVPTPVQVSENLPVKLPEMKPVLSGNQIYSNAKSSVYRLVIRLRGMNSKQSHGSAFVVDTRGFLITNFHVVLPYLESQNKNEMVVEVLDRKFPAEVLAIDSINDLALVKVNFQFNNSISIATESALSTGESIFSMGFPKEEELTIIQGIFNGQQSGGIAPFFRASIPLNGGMSGGPTFNSRGEVVAVNRAMLNGSQSISYLSPLASLQVLFSKISQNTLIASINSNWKRVVSQQILAQEKVYKVLSSRIENKYQKIGGYLFVQPFKNMECGQDTYGNNKSTRDVEILACQNTNLSLMSTDLNSLTFKFLASQVASSSFSANATSAANRSYLNSKNKMGSIKNERSPASVGNLAFEKCTAKNTSNIYGIKMLVRVCTLPIVGYQDIYNSYIKVDIKDSSKYNTSFALMYEGLSMDSIADSLLVFINSIRSEG